MLELGSPTDRYRTQGYYSTSQRHNDNNCQSELGWDHWLGLDGILRYSTGLGLSATQLGYSTALLDLDTWLDTG